MYFRNCALKKSHGVAIFWGRLLWLESISHRKRGNPTKICLLKMKDIKNVVETLFHRLKDNLICHQTLHLETTLIYLLRYNSRNKENKSVRMEVLLECLWQGSWFGVHRLVLVSQFRGGKVSVCGGFALGVGLSFLAVSCLQNSRRLPTALKIYPSSPTGARISGRSSSIPRFPGPQSLSRKSFGRL